MTRCRLDVDPEGWTVRPRTRQTRKEPTMPTIHAVSDRIPHPQEEAMSTHHLQLFAEDGEIRPRLSCTATPDAVCRRRPVDTDQESWTDEDETTPGHECWAVEWAEAAGWDTVTAADSILSSVDVEVTYDEGVVVDLAPPQPTLPDLAEPSDAEVRAAAEESTTDLGSIRDWYAGAVDEYWCDTGMLRDEAEAAFDRAIAAHDRALREQIAQKIEVEMRRHDNAQIGFSAVGDAYAHAARIAREEGQ